MSARRLALIVGIFIGITALLAATAMWEPHGTSEIGNVFAIVAACLSFVLTRFGISRTGT